MVRVRLNHVTHRFRILVDGVTVGRFEEVSHVDSPGGPLLVCHDYDEHDPSVRLLQLEVAL